MIQVSFIDNPFTSIPEMHSYTYVDVSNWKSSGVSYTSIVDLHNKIESKMKEIFPSIKFNTDMPTCFSFEHASDEAFFQVWSIDKQLEIETC